MTDKLVEGGVYEFVEGQLKRRGFTLNPGAGLKYEIHTVPGGYLKDPFPDPIVPHGYASWKDYAQSLESIGDAADKYQAKLEGEIAELRGLVDGDEDPTEPPQGYSTWLEYYQSQAKRREPDARMQALIDENEELRARISRQRRELKQVNRCIREQKLELEVLRVRGAVEIVYAPLPTIDPSTPHWVEPNGPTCEGLDWKP